MKKEQKQQKQFHTKTSLVMYFLSGSWQYFLLSILFACLVSLTDLINPKIIEYTVDSVIGSADLRAPAFVMQWVNAAGGTAYFRSHLYLLAGLVLAIAGVGALCRYLYMLFDSLGAETFVQKARDSLFSRIVRLPYAWHSENQTGDIIQRCTSDVETIKLFISEQLMALFRVVLLIVMSLWFMAGIHPGLALAEGLFIPVMVFSSVFFHNKVGSAFAVVDAEEGRLSSIAQENLTGVRVVRAFGRERFEQKRFHQQNEHYTNLWFRLQLILAAFWTSGNVYATVRNLVVTVLGVRFCVQGSLTAGGFIAFLSYNALISLPVRRLGRMITELSKAEISIDRLWYIMNAREEDGIGAEEAFGAGVAPKTVPDREAAETVSDREATEPAPDREAAEPAPDREAAEPTLDREAAELAPDRDIFRGDIVFDHVSFAYPSGTKEVLEDVTFTVKAGTTVGILGGTGSGKTTLISLLDRLYDLPEKDGSIRIGGKDLREIPRAALRRHIGLVLQEPYLFSRTLADNLAITADARRSKGIRKELDRAARIASLDETIAQMARGYDTFVGERGVTLSGGQRQRAAIAQMLMRGTPIMVFDDSLSAVDAETDARIRASLQEELANATVLLIAHRITTLMQADEIIVLDHGRIAERGTHESLLAAGGIYRAVYDLQTRDAKEELHR